MKPEEIVVLMTLVLMLGYGLSQAYTYRSLLLDLFPPPRQISGPDMWTSTQAPAPRPARPRTYTRRSPADRANEQRWIKAGLAEGLDPSWIAKNLPGNPIYNRRRIASVARML